MNPRYDQVGDVRMDWHGCNNCAHCVDGDCLTRYVLKLEKVQPANITEPEYIVVCASFMSVEEDL